MICFIISRFEATKVMKNRKPSDEKDKKQKAAEFQRLSCTPAGGRTLDTLIKSQVLYQLSYGSIVSGRKITHFFRTLNTFCQLFLLFWLN